MTCRHKPGWVCFKCAPDEFRPTREQAVARATRMLTDQLLKAKHAYYCKGSPIMTDGEFDGKEDSLRVIDPDAEYFKVVGCPVCGNEEKCNGD